jgi:hypothetical protein
MWILHAMANLATQCVSVGDGAALEGRSGGEAFVALMKPADLRNRDHLAAVRRLDGASIRAVFVERQMGPRAVIVIDVRPRIHGELHKLGIEVRQATVAKYMMRRRGTPSQNWRTFLLNHAAGIAAIDMFVVASASFRLLYVMIIAATL